MVAFGHRKIILRLQALYPVRATSAVAVILQRSVKSVYGTAAKLRLEKAASFLESPESGRLRKGQMRPGSMATGATARSRIWNVFLARHGACRRLPGNLAIGEAFVMATAWSRRTERR